MTINDELDRIFAARDRNNMQPTIDALLPLHASHSENARVLYEVGGAYDTAGQKEAAHGFYENALAAGLEGDLLRRDTPAIHFASAPAASGQSRHRRRPCLVRSTRLNGDAVSAGEPSVAQHVLVLESAGAIGADVKRTAARPIASLLRQRGPRQGPAGRPSSLPAGRLTAACSPLG